MFLNFSGLEPKLTLKEHMTHNFLLLKIEIYAVSARFLAVSL